MKLTEKQRYIVMKYGRYFNNTGGNDIIELIEREGVNYFCNPLVSELQGCCTSQLMIIESLIDADLLQTDIQSPDCCKKCFFGTGKPIMCDVENPGVHVFAVDALARLSIDGKCSMYC